MPSPRYLTKSRFKLALQCPTKLYYTGKDEIYANGLLDDPFMTALAEGGFQVGELAKFMFCDDPISEEITIESTGYVSPLKETSERLAKTGRVVIAEAAFAASGCFIRTDLLVREDNVYNLYEVKAKSFKSQEGTLEEETITDAHQFLRKDGKGILGNWQPYVYDLAFQKWVMKKALPKAKIKAHLLLVDKDANVSIAGMNQLFKLAKDGERTRVEVHKGLTKKKLGKIPLKAINCDEIIDKIWNEFPAPGYDDLDFESFVVDMQGIYAADKREWTPIGAQCAGCEFFSDGTEGLKSGFHECWKKHTRLSDDQLNQPLVTDLWRGLGGPSLQKLIETEKKYLLKDLTEEMIRPKNGKQQEAPGMSPLQRRMKQIEAAGKKAPRSYFDTDAFAEALEEWTWPLHMIDFETSMVALPFHKGTHPYQGIAFQFSHHILHENGKVEHKDQFLHFKEGEYPNLEFIRSLKNALSTDKGTILRYHNHENSYLLLIKRQLESNLWDIPEKERKQLIAFITDITRVKVDDKNYEYGKRSMVDLHDITRRVYYPPSAGGSISLKYILPAIIKDSGFLKEKYGKPGMYGKSKSMTSLNFEDQVWIDRKHEYNPYKTLPPVFKEYDTDQLDQLVAGLEKVADGGAAMTAYNYLQFSHISPEQKAMLEKSLLQYCELDTLAMVMLLEGYMNWGK